MIFDVMTLFCDMLEAVFSESIIGRAREKKLIEINTYNIRDYSKDKHKKVDDTTYGGGFGMLMAAPPIYDCFCHISEKYEEKPYTVYMSPKGRLLDQNVARELLEKEKIVILCGHYEGVDERVLEEIVDDEISIGDYVLTGGELPAAVLIDTVSRLVDGVLPDRECHEKESIASGLLEYPQYTRPYEFRGKKVPDVLISGHHEKIEEWRKEQSIQKTFEKRPELLEKVNFNKKEKIFLEKLEKSKGENKK